MTKREMYEFIANAMSDNQEVVDFCAHELENLDKKNARAKAYSEKKRAQDDELTEIVEAVLTAEPQTLDQITGQIEGDVTVRKVTARLTKLVNSGRAVRVDVTIPADAETGRKARKLKGYTIPTVDAQ